MLASLELDLQALLIIFSEKYLFLHLWPSNINIARPDNSKNVTSLEDHKPFFDSHSSICLFQCFGKNHCSGLQGFGAPIFLHRWRR